MDGGSRRGAFLHLLHAFTPDGTPLGSVYGTAWTRAEGTVWASLTRAERAAAPIEKKESHRWLQGFRQAAEDARHFAATQLILVADSESDIYEVLAEATAEPRRIDWIVRACQDRTLLSKSLENAGESHLFDHLAAQPELFRQMISVRGRKAKVACETRGRRQPRQSRKAVVAVRASRVRLRPPWRADRRLPPVAINVVWVREVDPPPGEEPVEWMLLTSLPVDNVEQVLAVIQYYCVRWMIEVFFRVLKSDCQIEDRLFEYLDRLLTSVGLYVIVAWRTLYVCRLGRSGPELDCDAVFEPSEWKSVWKVVKRQDPPAHPPPLGEFVRLVAQLGGYVNRKHANPPGPQTLWIGLQRMHDFATCWDLFGPETKKRPLTCV